ncbi:MAG: 6-phosphogluconolactonase, partial [Bacteroides sp.]
MKTFIYPSAIETARALILHLISQMVNAPDKIFNIAFSGGNTPFLMYDLWANEYKEATPWERMRIYFVDERCVPPENSESNYGVMRSLLLSVVPIPYSYVYPIRGQENPEKEAEYYSKLVESQVPMQKEWPVFDIVLLGAGEDGHTSSIFPGQEYLLTSSQVYEATFNPDNGQNR